MPKPEAAAEPEVVEQETIATGTVKDPPEETPEEKPETKPDAETPGEKPAEKPESEEKPKGEEEEPEEEEEAEKPKGPPEKYDLKVPEDSELSDEHVEKVAAYAKAQGLSNEQAQALLDRDAEQIELFKEQQIETIGTLSKEWLAQSKKDKEFGGEAFKENAELAFRVIDRFGTPALKKAMNQTGLGNHPELVRFIVRIGKSMGEDQLVKPGSQEAAGEVDMAEKFYGTPKDKK